MKKTGKAIGGVVCAALMLSAASVSVSAQDTREIITADVDFTSETPYFANSIGENIYSFDSDNSTSFFRIDDAALENWKATGELIPEDVSFDEQSQKVIAEHTLQLVNPCISESGNICMMYIDAEGNMVGDVIMYYDRETQSFRYLNDVSESSQGALNYFSDGTCVICKWINRYPDNKDSDVYDYCVEYYEGDDFSKPVRTAKFLDCYTVNASTSGKYYCGSVKMADGSYQIQTIDSEGSKRALVKDLSDVRILSTYDDALAFTGIDRSDNTRYTWIYETGTRKLYKIRDTKLNKFTCQGRLYTSIYTSPINDGHISIYYYCEEDDSSMSMIYDLNNMRLLSKACTAVGGDRTGSKPIPYATVDGKSSYFFPDGTRSGVWFDDVCEFFGDTTLVRDGEEVFFIDTDLNIVSDKLILDESYYIYSSDPDIFIASNDDNMMMITLK